MTTTAERTLVLYHGDDDRARVTREVENRGWHYSGSVAVGGNGDGVEQMRACVRQGRVERIAVQRISWLGAGTLGELECLEWLLLRRVAIFWGATGEEVSREMVMRMRGAREKSRVERSEIARERLERARARGVALGRPRGAMSRASYLKKHAAVVEFLSDGRKQRWVARHLGLSESTIARVSKCMTVGDPT